MILYWLLDVYDGKEFSFVRKIFLFTNSASKAWFMQRDTPTIVIATLSK